MPLQTFPVFPSGSSDSCLIPALRLLLLTPLPSKDTPLRHCNLPLGSPWQQGYYMQSADILHFPSRQIWSDIFSLCPCPPEIPKASPDNRLPPDSPFDTPHLKTPAPGLPHHYLQAPDKLRQAGNMPASFLYFHPRLSDMPSRPRPVCQVPPEPRPCCTRSCDSMIRYSSIPTLYHRHPMPFRTPADENRRLPVLNTPVCY